MEFPPFTVSSVLTFQFHRRSLTQRGPHGATGCQSEAWRGGGVSEDLSRPGCFNKFLIVGGGFVKVLPKKRSAVDVSGLKTLLGKFAAAWYTENKPACLPGLSCLLLRVHYTAVGGQQLHFPRLCASVYCITLTQKDFAAADEHINTDYYRIHTAALTQL